MKKILLLAFAVVFASALSAQTTAVTFRLDMKNVTVDPAGPRIAGDLQSEANIGPDWTPAGPGNQLTDPDGDKIYEIVLNLPAGSYQYKFLNGDAWGKDESIPSACATNGNRGLTVGATPITQSFCFGSCDPQCSSVVDVIVTFQVNMNGITVKTPGVILAGSFGQAGLPNWNGSGMGSILMEDPNNDGIYTFTDTLKTGTYQYKFLNGANGWEGVPCACQVGGNRELQVGTNTTPIVVSPVFIGDCDNTYNGNTPAPVTFQVDMSATTLGPGGLFVAGSFQPTPWSKNVDKLTDPDGDDIYTVTLDVPPGEHEYKFFNGDYTQGPAPTNTDYYAEAGGYYTFYDFRLNGCGCAGAGFNNRLLNVNSSTAFNLPIFVFNSCAFVTSTHDLSTAAAIKLYPNPMTEQAQLTFQGVTGADHTVVVTDALGRVVRTYAAFAGNQLVIEKGNLAAGLYLVSLQNARGERATVKLNIQ